MNVDLTTDSSGDHPSDGITGDGADNTSDAPGSQQKTNQRLPLRSRQDRYLGGVAGGIAQRLDIDPFIIRAAFLGSALFTAYAANWAPVVPAAYTVLWLTMPGANGRSAIREVRTPSGRRETVAAVASFAVIALLLTRPVFGFALALAALAWVLLSDETLAVKTTHVAAHGAETESAGLPLAAPPPAGAAGADLEDSIPNLDERVSWGQRRRSERGETLVANFARAPRRPRREPALWPLTLSLLAIISVGGFMADALLSDGLNPAIMVNAALIAIGAVIVLSAWRGRAMWTVLLAMALLPAWIGFSVADIGRFEGGGSTSHTPTAFPASGTLAYENGYGSMMIDLRQLPLAEGDELTLDIKATAGTVTVLAPSSTTTVLRSNIGLGTTTVSSNGRGFYEYDREPHMDRTMIRRYDAHGSGCIQEYWAAWSTMLANHEQAGVDLGGFVDSEPDDVEPILAAIVAAGFTEPQPIDDALDFTQSAARSYRVIDEFGNEFHLTSGGSYRVIDEFGNESYLSVEDAVPISPPAGGSFRVIDEFGNESYLSVEDAVPVAPPAGGSYRVIDEFGNEFYLSGNDRVPLPPPAGGSYRVIDEFGNEFYLSGNEAGTLDQQLRQSDPDPAFEQQPTSNILDRTWSYSADPDGLPCNETPPPDDPATIEINATIGIGTLEVSRDEF